MILSITKIQAPHSKKFIRLVIVLAMCLFSLCSIAQHTVEKIPKISILFKEKIAKTNPLSISTFLIVAKDRKAFFEYMVKQKINVSIIKEYEPADIVVIEAKWGDVSKYILTSDLVTFVDEKRIPKEELQINGFDLGTNKVNVVHNNFPQLNGDGLVVSIKENRMDTADIDFKGRYMPTTLTSSVFSSHASIMATMIAGAGNSYYEGKGVVWGATISSSDFSILLPDPDAAYQQYKITVQNHSYGTGIENFYGADAVAYDISAINNPSLLHVFSAGNSGNLTSTTGAYSGVKNYANITGSFKMAKNIITVGATDSFALVALLSSKGPAYDGRVKPEMVAFGIDGSSGAAALVSGTALLLQQQYKQLNNALPPNALVKAILLNSADDVGNKEVDYSNGYGSLNSLNAIRTLQNGRVFNGSVTNGTTQTFNVAIPAAIKKVKLTLVWNDPPAVANAPKALVNDLDLELMNAATGEIWKPWVLSSYPHIDSLQKNAVRKRDSLNNTEQITLEDPLAGNYIFAVKGFNVTTPSQNFYIAYQFDSTDVFEWNFPTGSDFIFPSQLNTLRWNSSFTAATGILEYSTDNGINWQTISSGVNLADGYYTWNTPSVATTALLKMTVGNNRFISNSFTISPRLLTGIGFNCPDSFLFYWQKTVGINNYRVYSLGNRYLEPVLTTTDTFAIFQKNTNPSLYYTVAPVIGNKEGVKSYTINYKLQGVECYIRSFLAALVGNNAELTLLLGTQFNITSIVLEKFNGTGFQPIQGLSNNNNLVVIFNDSNLTKGLNIYRVKINLAGGGFVYSLPETIYYFFENNYIVYPNPAPQYSEINIAAKTVDISIMEVYNALGVKVYEKVLDDRVNKIPPGKLSKGVYFIRVTNKGDVEDLLKLVVY
ncbi:MAG: C-terminal target protein [Chitinophagaceae bacterium]|nr:C-terminal target protein [Chitinophagaceae bacterium]